MKVSILQWNIWYKEKIEDIAKFLQSDPADIICLQELSIDNPGQTIKNATTYIAEQLGYEYVNQEISFEDDDMKLANAIFSKYPIANSRTVWINEPSGTGHYDDEYRAYVEADIKIGEETLCVGTVHMSYTNAFELSQRKTTENKRLLAEILSKNKQYVLTGDFNSMPDSPVINQLSEILINLGPNLAEKTWTTKPFSYDGFEADTLDWRLDYIFSTPDIKAKNVEILKTDLSDHLPILALIEL